MRIPTLLITSSLAVPMVLAQDRLFTITNNCPAAIPVFIDQESQGTLGANSVINITLPGDFSGTIYTTANGGSTTGVGTTVAGFHSLDNSTAEYYFIKDLSHFNVGMEIQPRNFGFEGICGSLVCNDATCSAFLQPPTSFPSFDELMQGLPPPPFAICSPVLQPLSNGFFVTFCPDGSFPSSPTVGVTLHPNGDTEKCLDVRGAVFEDGTPVQIFDCNDTPAQRWILNRDTTQVTVAGTNFCLDAGTTPGNNTPMKIWECFFGLTQQTWFYTDDNRIALQGQGQCLDLTNGILTNSNQVQIFQCTDLDTNQIWITG